MAFNQNIEMVGPSASAAAGSAGSTTETVNIPATGVYTVAWKCELPLARDGAGASGLVVRVRNTTTSTNIFLGTAGACSSGQVWFSASAADAIALNLSSTDADDLVSLNCIKATFSVSSGV